MHFSLQDEVWSYMQIEISGGWGFKSGTPPMAGEGGGVAGRGRDCNDITQYFDLFQISLTLARHVAAWEQ